MLLVGTASANFPSSIKTCKDLEVYYGRFLGLVLATLALTIMLLTGSIPLTSSISEPVSVDGDDSKAPYAVPVVRLTSIFHFIAFIYCYTSYMSYEQTGFLLGTVGYGFFACMGLWCVMFATSGGLISKRTGADKRMAGFPFKNEKAYSTKADKKAGNGRKGDRKGK